MPRQKRKAPDDDSTAPFRRPPSIRRSSRLAARGGTQTMAAPMGRQLSGMSTDMEEESDKDREAEAMERVHNYDYKEKENVVNCLLSCAKWFPEAGKMSLVRDILRADSDKMLYAVYRNFYTALFVPMKAASRQPSVDPSPVPKRQQNAELVASTIDKLQTRIASFPENVFKRDDYRCVVSGDVDSKYHQQMGLPEDVRDIKLNGAHIIPFSYGSWKEKGVPENVASIWEMLYRCFPGVRRACLTVDTINSPENGLTMNVLLHAAFGEFRVAFKETDIKHQYEIKTYGHTTYYERQMIPTDRLVTFTQAEGHKDIPLPDPALLNCHYRVAEILHATGLAEVIDRDYDRWNELRHAPSGAQLQEDGSTDLTHYLDAAFWWAVTPTSPTAA
ncbi:hypothetical protein BO94DRAFT_536927 [Aspergillus sclerotioniger CBS 115572]|uniref:HNH nuclease domain-containing protein n=1 Tax=Aspergillus sclerotioniger CBS 115572 TaxID=1450535 RepID=A0A317W5U2_9EURO|nr:hypothetical protein BO94DRAFT_536927 [Aspergillus sclerotioniger CBS 115572]PWY81703.1 hypothetical protein BO94DRAFT_536927 [Aspergillus sclerotioniger CBS 115572]